MAVQNVSENFDFEIHRSYSKRNIENKSKLERRHSIKIGIVVNFL